MRITGNDKILNLNHYLSNVLSFQFTMKKKQIWSFLLLLPFAIQAQNSIPLNDLSFWKTTNKTNWQIVADAQADLNVKEILSLTPGKGILANLPNKENRANLVSNQEFGDFDLSFEFMMASHSNSGFYLQGRYEMQLADSWGVVNPTTGDCGGIYKRRKFNPKEYLYDGHAPRVNACLAPGLWQKMEVSFQAPRFDASGNKISNAKVILAKLNGVIIHENVALTGPTGGPISETEVAKGPFMVQGDHGAVAFRNIAITDLSDQPATMDPISYQVFYGNFPNQAEFLSKKPDLTGITEKLTWDVSSKPFHYAETFKTFLNIPKAGKHQIEFEIAGKHWIKINGKEFFKEANEENNRKKSESIDLPAGKVALEITIIKTKKSVGNKLGFWIKGPNFRTTPYQSIGSFLGSASDDPILLEANEPLVFRSFMDLFKNGKRGKRIVHAVNVGNPAHLHYTYNLDNGSIAQIWKGDFLNTTPMWDNRGDGSSRPLGAILALQNVPVIVSKSEGNSANDTPEASLNFKIKGYDVDKNNLPTFNYEVAGSDVKDLIRIKEDKYLERILTIKNPSNAIKIQVAVGTEITEMGPEIYAIDGKSYYIQAKGATVESNGLLKILTLPASEKVQYSILW